MKNFFFSCLFTFLILSTSLKGQEISTVKITEIVQEIDKDDDTTRIVNVWATWCAPCIKELPYFEEINSEFKDQKIKIILLAVEDTKESVQKFVGKKNIQSQVMLLDETDGSYWIPKINVDWQGEIPVTLLVNKAHQIKKFHAGEINKEQLIKFIQESSN